MMRACVLTLSLRCIDVYGHGCELGCVEVVDVVYSAFFWCRSAKNWESTV